MYVLVTYNDRDPGSPHREERIQMRRDDTEIATLKRELAALKEKQLRVIIVDGVDNFMDCLLGLASVPREGDFLNMPAPFEWIGEKSSVFRVRSVTWHHSPEYGWQPVCCVYPAGKERIKYNFPEGVT